MIEDVVNGGGFDEYNTSALRDLCQKVYLIESSIDERSSRKVRADIKDEIMRRALEVSARSDS